MRRLKPFVGAFVFAACTGTSDEQVLSPVVLGMLETTPPAYDDGQQQIYQVSKEVKLPFRQPEDAERPSGKADPYPRPPFHIASDSRVTVRFTLTNLENKKHNVDLLIDPWNEFVRYVPGVTTVRDEEQQPNFSGIQRTFVLDPLARASGIITPDDMRELAVDLTVAMSLSKRPPPADGDFGGATLYNRTFNIQNRSSEPDPVLRDWMPPSRDNVASVIGFDLGLRTEEPARIAIELVIDVDDLNGKRVAKPDDGNAKTLGPPGTELTPPAGAAN